METINILIADDHDLIYNGIKDMLRTLKRYKILGKAANGKEAIEKAIELKPDIIFMDISMPLINGIDATKKILSVQPRIKILALTQHEENEYVLQMLKAGGRGYLLKNSKKEEFVNAIESVMNGEKYFSKSISEQMISAMLSSSNKDDEHVEEVTLTKREREIIQKIANDKSNQQIADELHISLRTVETHRRNLMQKLKLNTVVSLLKYAAKHNLVSLE